MAEWKEIETKEAWDEARTQSSTQPVLLLKHSTSCPISAGAMKACQQYIEDNAKQDVDYRFVKVIESRDVSNQIATELNVKHESPQLILIRDQKAVADTSHQAITKEKITEMLG